MNKEQLRAEIEALHFTLIVPNPVVVTLGESQITENILALFDSYLQVVRKSIQWPEKRPVDWQQISTPELIAKQSESYGFDLALDECKAAIDKGFGV